MWNVRIFGLDFTSAPRPGKPITCAECGLEQEAADNLPAPEELAREIAEDLQAALEQFSSIYEELEVEPGLSRG